MDKKKKSLTKEQQQIAMLGIVLAIIIGVLAYMYYDKFLPTPVNPGVPVSVQPHLNLKSADPTELFKRPDFRSLRGFGEVPVRVLSGEGNGNPFDLGLE